MLARGQSEHQSKLPKHFYLIHVLDHSVHADSLLYGPSMTGRQQAQGLEFACLLFSEGVVYADLKDQKVSDFHKYPKSPQLLLISSPTHCAAIDSILRRI